MATLAQLETALVNADKAGDMDAARKLAPIIKAERARIEPFKNIPGYTDIQTQVTGTEVKPAEPSIGEKVLGAGEAALSTVTGATTGAAGMIGGFLKGLAADVLSGKYGTQEGADIVGKSMEEGAAALTYAPRTQAGQQYVENIGGVMQAAMPLMPATAELGAIAESASAVRPVLKAVAQDKAAPIAQATADLAGTVKAKIAGAMPGAENTAPAAGTGASAGAAAVDMATLRREAAASLPVPIKDLTEGQATRGFEQQRFERETAKMGDVGEPIRQRFQDHNLKLQQNMDAFIDGTGAELSDLRGIGEAVDNVLVARQKQDKTRVRALYKEARNSEEAKLNASADKKVSISNGDGSDFEGSPIDYLNSRPSKTETSKAVDDARANGVNLKVLVKNEDGTFGANPETTVGQLEDWRREISQSLSKTASDTEIRDVTVLKKLIDSITEPLAGPLYKQARTARYKLARDYENSSIASRLLGEKAGSTDRAIALEDVLKKVVFEPSTSLDQMRHVRRLLQTKTGGTQGAGAQAWREIQGGALRHIRDEALKGVTTDTAGNRVVSAAALDRVVTQLDKTGKLDYVLGKQKAEQVRTMNDVAKTVMTSPPGSVNNSNTATVLAGLIDVATSGMTGIPLPVASGVKFAVTRIKDAKLRARVKHALGE